MVTDARGIAVAVNGAVVCRGDWPSTMLREHDRIEVITAHQGG
ncbi:sulfur carrier protein ThiS [Aeromicrobium sp.]|nr:sulfur carrier protein ThiS [Aeromicrobium sp.]